VSALAKTAGPKLDGCAYCALILFAIYSQADYLIRENANLRVFFPLYGGITIRDFNLTKAETASLVVYTPKGMCSPNSSSQVGWANFQNFIGEVPP
jgi:hypothetical protein